MKNIATIIFMLAGVSMEAMEDQENRWNWLPNEIKALVIDYVGKRNKSLADFFKCALVSPEFACFVLNHPLTQVKKYKPVDKKGKVELKDLLIGAIQAGDAHAVKALIAFKGDLAWARTEDQDTMLILATKAGHKEIVELLVRGGGVVHAQSRGATALDIARDADLNDIADLLISYGATADKRYGFYAIAGSLIEHDANIEATNDNDKNVISILMRLKYDILNASIN